MDIEITACAENIEATVLVSAFPVSNTPGGSLRLTDDTAVLLTNRNDNLVIWRPPGTPVMESPGPSTPAYSFPSPRRRRRRPKQIEDLTAQYLRDSGSEFENDDEDYDEEVDEDDIRNHRSYDILSLREVAHRLEELRSKEAEVSSAVAGQVGAGHVNGGANGGIKDDDTLDPTYTWSQDFSTFEGREELYTRSPGPAHGSQNPLDLFLLIWDQALVESIVVETNRYAWQTIAALSERGKISANLDKWEETTVPEMYRYFAVLIYMALDHRCSVIEYWTSGVLSMPNFRRIMSRNRFQMLSRFIHFVDNDYLSNNLRSYERKVAKISPLLERCNDRFLSLYTPSRHLSLDESLLLWKGNLSWKQCIRTKAARFGIKSFELCEATTGYMLKCILYAGKDSSMHERSLYGFSSATEKVVLKLMEGFLDVGHCLVLDNWYNQLPLARHLKIRKTDVIGTLNRKRQHVPDIIKDADERMSRGAIISCHCGDLSITAWKDVKLVTMISTYHNDSAKRRPRQETDKPSSVSEYNKYMGGVDLKDQKLSMYLMERNRGTKWYVKVFKRLLNTSILNAYIMYQRNPTYRVLTHREFRSKLADDLLARFPREVQRIPVEQPVQPVIIRLDGIHHYCNYTHVMPGRVTHSRRRCVRCTARGVRTQVNTLCSKCQVALCIGKCFQDYHTLLDLS